MPIGPDEGAIAAQMAAENSYRAARDERMAAAAVRAQSAEDRARASETRFVVSRFRGGVPLDDLTRVLRRGAGMELIDRELNRAARLDEPLTLAFVDVDQLKVVNDELGHVAGDEVLRGVARVLTEHLRPYDIIVRYGGDEFLVVFVDTDIGHARTRLGAVGALLSDGLDVLDHKVQVTISFGLAERGIGRDDRAPRQGGRRRPAHQAHVGASPQRVRGRSPVTTDTRQRAPSARP